MSRQLKTEYTIDWAIRDLFEFAAALDMYTEMMIELEILKKEGHHYGMAEKKAKEQYKKAHEYMGRLHAYLLTRQEITETQRLLYTKSKTDD